MSRRKKGRWHKVTLPVDKMDEINAELRNRWVHLGTEELTGVHDRRPSVIVSEIRTKLVQDGWVPTKDDTHASAKTLKADMDVHIASLAANNVALRAAVDAFSTLARNTRATRRAQSLLDWLQVIVPKRLNKEDVGDALEQINDWASDPTCRHVRAKIAIKVISTIAFSTLNAVRYFVASLTGKKTD